jgi:hypothetical protein
MYVECPSIPGIPKKANFNSQNQMVAQSLICLRSSLEALRLKRSGFLEPRWHESCFPTRCTIDLINTLQKTLSLYLDELSRVFFKKENLIYRKPWWLSAFYSFCIQSYVRENLIQLEMRSEIESSSLSLTPFPAEKYLRLPLRLFIARSGNFDPITTPPLNACENYTDWLDYYEAQLTTDQKTWSVRGMKTFGQYLESLYVDDEQGLLGT